jgi:hypothetical protein
MFGFYFLSIFIQEMGKSLIEYVGPTCDLTNSMINLQKKKKIGKRWVRNEYTTNRIAIYPRDVFDVILLYISYPSFSKNSKLNLLDPYVDITYS